MAERPIKKSERQSSNGVEERLEAAPASSEGNFDPEPSSPRRERSPNKSSRGKGKGKDKRREKEAAPPINPALMRGPRPTRPKPPVVKTAEASEDEATPELDQDASQESTNQDDANQEPSTES
jgi:hypothetical protein